MYSVHENVNSLKLLMPVSKIELKKPDQQFSFVSLYGPNLTAFPYFEKIRVVELREFAIKEIFPLRNVPCLTLNRCQHIQDFHCLGSQDYLLIFACSTLTNEDVTGFGNIPSLLFSSVSESVK
jgi:hypothetical protein